MEDDGIFIFDYWEKNVLNNKNEKRSWSISEGNDFWSNEPYLLMEEVKIFKNEYTEGNGYYLINQLNGKIKEYIIWEQYYDEDIIKSLMTENGFEIIEIKKDLVKYNELNKEEAYFVIVKKIN